MNAKSSEHLQNSLHTDRNKTHKVGSQGTNFIVHSWRGGWVETLTPAPLSIGLLFCIPPCDWVVAYWITNSQGTEAKASWCLDEKLRKPRALFPKSEVFSPGHGVPGPQCRVSHFSKQIKTIILNSKCKYNLSLGGSALYISRNPSWAQDLGTGCVMSSTWARGRVNSATVTGSSSSRLLQLNQDPLRKMLQKSPPSFPGQGKDVTIRSCGLEGWTTSSIGISVLYEKSPHKTNQT